MPTTHHVDAKLAFELGVKGGGGGGVQAYHFGIKILS